jgi:hypothetical protein
VRGILHEVIEYHQSLGHKGIDLDRAEAKINQLRTAELETLRNEKREIIFGDGIRREAIPMTALDALIERVKGL